MAAKGIERRCGKQPSELQTRWMRLAEDSAVEANPGKPVDPLAAPHSFGVADYAINQSYCAPRADLT
jgi:hypothetical protein